MGGTADKILNVAEKLVQSRGFNAFSYQDVSKAVGIQKASLHYHFATKADLGVALIDRYRGNFLEALEGIEEKTPDAKSRLERYAELYGAVLRKKRMCMCGMLATDAATLPKAMRDSVAAFFEENAAWLARVLDEGRKRKELDFEGTAQATAEFFVSALEGAMLVAHGSGKHDTFDAATGRLLATVRPRSAVAREAKRKTRTGR
jgi:TetR/AcrR family transcriptional regulator, transcriptional repressor for nem operon